MLMAIIGKNTKWYMVVCSRDTRLELGHTGDLMGKLIWGIGCLGFLSRVNSRCKDLE